MATTEKTTRRGRTGSKRSGGRPPMTFPDRLGRELEREEAELKREETELEAKRLELADRRELVNRARGALNGSTS